MLCQPIVMFAGMYRLRRREGSFTMQRFPHLPSGQNFGGMDVIVRIRPLPLIHLLAGIDAPQHVLLHVAVVALRIELAPFAVAGLDRAHDA